MGLILQKLYEGSGAIRLRAPYEEFAEQNYRASTLFIFGEALGITITERKKLLTIPNIIYPRGTSIVEKDKRQNNGTFQKVFGDFLIPEHSLLTTFGEMSFRGKRYAGIEFLGSINTEEKERKLENTVKEFANILEDKINTRKLSISTLKKG